MICIKQFPVFWMKTQEIPQKLSGPELHQAAGEPTPDEGQNQENYRNGVSAAKLSQA